MKMGVPIPGMAALMEGGFPQLKRSLNPVPPKAQHSEPTNTQPNFAAHLRPSKNTETQKEPAPSVAPRKIAQSTPAPTTHTNTQGNYTFFQ